MIQELFGNSPASIRTLMVVGSKQYSFKRFIGENFVMPMRDLGVKDFGKTFQTVYLCQH